LTYHIASKGTDMTDLIALEFQKKVGRKTVETLAILIEEMRSEVVFEKDGPLSPLVLRNFYTYWPVAEVAVQEMSKEPWMQLAQLEEIAGRYRAHRYDWLEKEKGVWKVKAAGREPAAGSIQSDPREEFDLSPEATNVVNDYVRGRQQNKARRNLMGRDDRPNPDRVIDRGLPRDRCTYFQPPAPASAGKTAQERREILLVQDEDGELSISLCGYAKIAEEGKWFEVFVPLAESSEDLLGATDGEILQTLTFHAARHAATRVWWITKDSDGWRQGMVADGVAPGWSVEMTPKASVLGVSMLALEDYLGWRSKSYGMDIRLLDASDEATILRTFKKGRETEEGVPLTD
jgi:hypothetical protein